MMHIAIIGAGLVGRILAWRLNVHFVANNQELSISLIEQNDRHFGGTGLIAAAMVAPYTEAVSTEAITQTLGKKSYALWQQWLPELEEQTKHTIGFNQKGSLVLSHAQDMPDFERFQIKAQTVVTANNYKMLDRVALTSLEPEIAKQFTSAMYFKQEGVIDNQALYLALNTYFEQSKNITWIENTVIDAIKTNGRITGIEDNFDQVFDCRGNGAKADLKNFRSVRGEVARVYAPEVNISRAVRLIHPRYPLYIAPRKNHEYIIGATQLESDDDSPVTVRSGLELLSALYSLHSGFSEANILQLQTGLRPTFSDNQPRIQTINQLTRINGLYRHGYLFTPILIDQLIKETF